MPFSGPGLRPFFDAEITLKPGKTIVPDPFSMRLSKRLYVSPFLAIFAFAGL